MSAFFFISNSFSEFGFYGLQILLIVLEGIAATVVLVKSQGWKECGRFQFRWAYLGVFFLFFILMFVWVNITTLIFPSTQNGSEMMKEVANLTGISYFIMRILYGSLIAPIVEELVFRGLLMTSLSRFKKYYLDVVVSSTLFSLIHILQYGWVLTDFIVYAGAGLLFSMLFRYTHSVYWSMALHILWNTFLIVVSLLVFRY
ncbi:type II CAAX endopeptidase family protein [Streptococcus infantis]|uniref:CPBP family intramembrane glutamic endopeptidase n=1 Tax=Streptococcus infantis TaxID=68892 RepID=UPI0039C47E95